MPQQTSSYMFLHLSDFDKNSKGKHIMAFDVLILLDGNVTYSRHHYKSTCQSEQNQYELCTIYRYNTNQMATASFNLCYHINILLTLQNYTPGRGVYQKILTMTKIKEEKKSTQSASKLKH